MQGRHDTHDMVRIGRSSLNRGRAQLSDWIDDRHAGTAMEYVLIGAGISIVIVGGIALIGGSIEGLFDTVGVAVGGG